MAANNLGHKVALILMVMGSSWAASAAVNRDQSMPLILEADKAFFSQQKQKTVYSGNVHISQGTLQIFAQEIEADLTPSRKLAKVNAKGTPVRFAQQLPGISTLSRGQANQLTYDAKAGVIVLTGQAKLEHNGATFNGATLRYSMNQGDIEALGDKTGRVRLVIPANDSPVAAPLRNK